MSRFYYPAFPNSWFQVAWSDELAIGEVKPLHYFGRDLVAFRGEDNVVHVLDAHCPHLGANLAMGGKVVGNNVQCPFHGWCFDGEGKCTSIPYTTKIPHKAKVNNWPVRETNGIIMVYFHAAGKSPNFEIPVIKGDDGEDLIVHEKMKWRVHCRSRDLVENLVDPVHIKFLHGNTVIPEATFAWGDYSFDIYTIGKEIVGEQEIEGRTHFSIWGAGCLILNVWSGGQKLPFVTCNYMSPVDEEYVDFYMSLLSDKAVDETTKQIISLCSEKWKSGAEEDIIIWNHKICPERPILCEGDGPIMQFRRWYSQFFISELVDKDSLNIAEPVAVL
ncbi:Rieske (2Fe-2S) region [Nostoc sp. NIES-4103]|nr:Rieske (2Fe-2S) region [Nostoc sp. NIES-4103]